MKYDKLESSLTLKFSADELDILEFGNLNYHLHCLLNQVAISMLNLEDERRMLHGEEKLLETIPQTMNRDDALIRARIVGVRQGSVELDLQTAILSIASTPGAASILQNLAANTIWAIGIYAQRVAGAKILKRFSRTNQEHLISPVSARKRLGSKVEKFVKQLAESPNGGRLYLRSGDEELEIEFNSSRRIQIPPRRTPPPRQIS